jgi:hypothetical protein
LLTSHHLLVPVSLVLLAHPPSLVAKSWFLWCSFRIWEVAQIYLSITICLFNIAMARSTILKNGKPSISMGHLYYTMAMLVITRGYCLSWQFKVAVGVMWQLQIPNLSRTSLAAIDMGPSRPLLRAESDFCWLNHAKSNLIRSLFLQIPIFHG